MMRSFFASLYKSVPMALLMAGCGLVVDLPEPLEETPGSGGRPQGTGGATGSDGGSLDGSFEGDADTGAGGTSPASGGGGGSANSAGSGGSAAGMGGGLSLDGSDCVATCDCDGDGFEASGCGGPDCDDHDPNVRPNQNLYFSVPAPNPDVGFDYDCDGSPSKDPVLDQTVSCLLILCDLDARGYLASRPPACGAPGVWGKCRTDVATCGSEILDPARIMRCK